MAAACAVACRASALIFLTDVAGVKGADGSVIRWLNLGQVNELVATSIVSGGMLPKLEACRHALNRGVGRVRIFPASEAEALAQFYFEKSGAGTEVRVA
jgi:acetylglutamate kinase